MAQSCRMASCDTAQRGKAATKMDRGCGRRPSRSALESRPCCGWCCYKPRSENSSRLATILGDTDRLAVCATNTTEALNRYRCEAPADISVIGPAAALPRRLLSTPVRSRAEEKRRPGVGRVTLAPQ